MKDNFKDIYDEVDKSKYSQKYYDIIEKLGEKNLDATEASNELKLLYLILERSFVPNFYFRFSDDVMLDWCGGTRKLRVLQDGREWDARSCPADLRCTLLANWDVILEKLGEGI